MVDRKVVLERVAAGELDPREAVRLLAEDEPDGAGGPAAAPGGVARVQVRCGAARVVVTGDAAVREAVADGPHVARLDGDVLVIEGQLETRGFSFGRHGLGWGIAPRGLQLAVRVNPLLPLRLEVAAGTAMVRGVRAPIVAEVAAGSLTIEGFAAPLNLVVEAGSVHATGRLDRGDSRVRCDVGRAVVVLEPGSSVAVRARSTLGKVSLPGGSAGSGPGIGDTRTAVVGGGAGRLEVETTAGRVEIRG